MGSTLDKLSGQSGNLEMGGLGGTGIEWGSGRSEQERGGGCNKALNAELTRNAEKNHG